MSATTRSTLTRAEVPVEQTWRLEGVFASNADWEAEFARLDAGVATLAVDAGHLGESGARLLAALLRGDEYMNRLAIVSTFAHLRKEQDATDATYVAMAARADGLSSRAHAAIAFVEPELVALDPDRLRQLIASEPGLAVYGHYFDKLEKRRPHVRDAQVEAVLALAGDVFAVPYRVDQALKNADMQYPAIVDDAGQTIAVTAGTVGRYTQNRDRRVRRDAWNSVADAHLSVKHTAAAALAGSIQHDALMAKVRGYSSCLEAELAPNQIPTAVFHNLLAVVWRNFPVWQRFFRVRARMLGLAKAAPYDLGVPLSTNSPQIGWERSVELICEGLQPLGDEYVDIVRRGIADRWVDRTPNVGKSSGAFSGGVKGMPPVIMMNFADNAVSLGTLAHELGHSMHSYYTHATQPWVYSNYSMFVAEVASNMNQALVGRHLLATQADRDLKLAVLDERFSNYRRYLFTMPILAKFEFETHSRVERGEALTADGMSDLLAGIFREAFGDAVEIDPPRQGIIWAEFPHLFAPYYVFQYATGIAAASALAQQVLQEGAPAAKRYIEFLKTGDARYPIDAIKLAGIDMTDPAPIQRVFDELDEYITLTEQLLAS